VMAACTCLALGAIALMPPQPGVTKSNFGRIQNGMTRAEVEMILGCPGGPAPFANGPGDRREWLGWDAEDGFWVWIGFTGDCVAGKSWQDSEETFLEKIRRWLHIPQDPNRNRKS